MLFQAVGEAVVAGAIGDEVKKVGAVRVQGGRQRAFPWIGDGPGWQAREAIGVVGRVYGHIGMMEAPLVSAFQQLGIDHARVGVEGHVFRQAIVVDAGHARPFLRSSRLFFYDRCHGDDFGNVRVQPRGRPGIEPDLLCDLAELADHRRHHFLRGLGAGELVGVGEEIALQRFRVRRQIRDQLGLGFSNMQKIGCRSETGVFHRLGNIEHGEAFGDGDNVEVDIAARDAIVNLGKSRLALEKILTRLQGWFGMQHVPQTKDQFAADHPGLFQLGANPASGVPGMQQQSGVGPRRGRDVNLPGQPAASRDHGKQEQFSQRAHGSSVEAFSDCYKVTGYGAGDLGNIRYSPSQSAYGFIDST